MTSGDNRAYILTLDECMRSLDYTNAQSEYYHAPKNVKEGDRPPLFATCAQQFPEQHMMAAGFTWRGPTRLYIVPPKTKITAEYFVKQVLTPMFDVGILKLYGKEAGKVVLHMDSASSHAAQKTVQWLESRKIKCIPEDEWLPNIPELSPMDYFANGSLKKTFKKQRFWSGGGLEE